MVSFAEELEKSGYIVFTNKGISMMPLLRQDKDIIVIRKITGNLKKNDVVLFLRDNGEYVLHRIIKVHNNGSYTIMGDNCHGSEIVDASSIIGILTEINRDGKRILMTDRDYVRYTKTLPFRHLLVKLRAGVHKFIVIPIYKLKKRIKGE